MSDDIVDELNFYAQRAEADEKVLSLLAEAAGTIQCLRTPYRVDSTLADFARLKLLVDEYDPEKTNWDYRRGELLDVLVRIWPHPRSP